MKAGRKVLFDTNVWLSAAVFPGLCAELLLALDAAGHRLLTSERVRAEAHDVLRRKFARHAAALERFDALWACAACVPDAAGPADDSDARLVAAARAAGADVFVTGDQRVLGWDAPEAAMSRGAGGRSGPAAGAEASAAATNSARDPSRRHGGRPLSAQRKRNTLPR